MQPQLSLLSDSEQSQRNCHWYMAEKEKQSKIFIVLLSQKPTSDWFKIPRSILLCFSHIIKPKFTIFLHRATGNTDYFVI